VHFCVFSALFVFAYCYSMCNFVNTIINNRSNISNITELLFEIQLVKKLHLEVNKNVLHSEFNNQFLYCSKVWGWSFLDVKESLMLSKLNLLVQKYSKKKLILCNITN